MSSISPTVRKRIAKEAAFRCGYCLTQERVSGVPLTIEHLLPRAKGGDHSDDNLWLSCRLCNEAKGVVTEAIDPESYESVPIFNPRLQSWHEHFEWSECGTRVIGISAIGRATVVTLSLNSEFRRVARALWVEVGWHPPV